MVTTFAYRTVLFDVDGTLMDTNAAHAESWAQAFSERGIQATASDVRPLVGMGGDKVLQIIAHVDESSALGASLGKRKKELFSAALPGLRPTRGARQLLEHLIDRNIGLVVATSAGHQEMRAILQQGGLFDLFSERTTKDDAEESKPDPDIVLAALARAEARPESTVMVGDTPYDIEAAQRAGIQAIALRCGGHWTDADLGGAVGIYDDPSALLEALSRTRE
jgi:HAD superfamily hydrolase (TIGR01509 family)